MTSAFTTCWGREGRRALGVGAVSMQPMGPGKLPAETVRVARAAFPKGSLAITVRDELGPLFGDEEFADLFPTRGRPAWSPGRLALVLVLQFVEGLTDRQAAEAVRARIDFKYALGLDLEDPGFDYSVLSEFRERLVQADARRQILDGILVAARDKGLLKTAGRARTDSTHVLSAARELSWLEMVTETCVPRSTLWRRQLPSGWAASRSGTGSGTTRFRLRSSAIPRAGPSGKTALRVGRDGTRLLQAVWSVEAPEGLRTLQQVETLRQVWVQCFQQVEGEVRNRDPKDRPRGAMRLVTPYDTEARGSIKKDLHWNGYKVHFTETCEPDRLEVRLHGHHVARPHRQRSGALDKPLEDRAERLRHHLRRPAFRSPSVAQPPWIHLSFDRPVTRWPANFSWCQLSRFCAN